MAKGQTGHQEVLPSASIQFIVWLSSRLVLSSTLGETMASKLPKVSGQSSAEGAGKSISASICRPERWGQALQSACLRLTPPQGVPALALPGQRRCSRRQRGCSWALMGSLEDLVEADCHPIVLWLLAQGFAKFCF